MLLCALNAPNTWYMVGKAGEIFESDFNGSGWTSSNAFAPPALYAVHAINSSTLIAAGDNYYLSMSKDGGNSWADYEDPLSNHGISGANINDVYFTDEGRGFIITDNGEAYTHNPNVLDGAWSGLQTTADGVIDASNPTEILHEISMLNAQRGIIAGENILYYSDNGIYGPWKTVDNISSISQTSFAASYVGEDHAFAAGSGGDVIAITRATNGNLTASQLGNQALLGNEVYALHFTDRLRGYAVGQGGHLSITTNGGVDWEDKGQLTTTDLHCINFTALGQAQFMGNSGALGHLTDLTNYFLRPFLL